jgi:hypothetical protein
MVQKKRYGPIEAFEIYYIMGERRSLAKLAEKLKDIPDRKGPSLRTLKAWSSKHEWREQIELRNSELRRVLAEKTVRSIAEYKTGFLKKVDSIIETGFERDGTPIITCEKARDLKDLIELSLKLLGEEERKKLQVEINIGKRKK